MSIVYLEISSYIGWQSNATHYYGKLVSNGDSFSLQHALTKQESRLWSTPDFTYDEGIEVEGFLTKTEIIQLALETYKDYFPNTSILVLGSHIYLEPQLVLDMKNKNKMERLNLLFKQAEEIGFWDNDEAQMQKIEDEWRSVLNEI